MVLREEVLVVEQPVADVVKAIVLGAFTLLTAFGIRDVFTQTVEVFLPESGKKRLYLQYFYLSVIFFVTVLLAVLWQDSLND